MTTAILGLGNMGKGLARRLAGKTDLILAARDERAAGEFAVELGGTARAASIGEAIAQADTVVLAVFFDAALEIAGVHAKALAGKTVIDITNPIKPDFSGLAFGFDTSAAEKLQAAAPDAHVVKAYNTIFAELFAEPETTGVPVFVAGDSEAAVASVADLVRLSGFAPETVGALANARLIEPLGMLNITLGYGLGRGTAIAPAWLRLAA